jgi:Gpi18-like mannosyltransferase
MLSRKTLQNKERYTLKCITVLPCTCVHGRCEMSVDKVGIKNLLAVVLSSRLLVFFIAVVSNTVIPQHLLGVPELKVPFFGLFAKWDSFYYLGIASRGYSASYPPSYLSRFWAFRPFYPFLLWLLGSPFAGLLGKDESFLITGVLWNTFAFTIAAIYLYKLTQLMLDQESAYHTVLFLSFFPGTVFFTAIQPESTYILLTVASFYYLEKSKIFRAVLLATLAGFTRPEGFLLFIPFVWKIFNLKGKREKLKLLLGSATVVSTLPAFILQSYFITGDPYISFNVEGSWSKETLWDVVTRVFSGQPLGVSNYMLAMYSISTIVLVVAVLSVAMYFYDLRSKGLFSITFKSDQRMPYYILTIVLLTTFIYQGGYCGFCRFTSVLFPILWGNVVLVKNHPLRTQVLLSIHVTLMALGTSFFVNWYHFA